MAYTKQFNPNIEPNVSTYTEKKIHMSTNTGLNFKHFFMNESSQLYGRAILVV